MNRNFISILESLKSKKDEAALGTEVGLPIDKENCEATDASMVSTPTGKITNKILCPECNSDNVNIYDDSTMHCVDCDHKWKPSSESSDEDNKDNMIDDTANEISSIFTKYSVSSKFTKTALRDYIYNTFGKKPGVSNDWCIANTGKDRYEVQVGKNSYDVSSFQDIHKVYNEAKRLGYVVEATTYKVGKRYKTEDDMYFTVKKIHKDGTILVHDEDVDKEYDVEVSDLELLHPVEIKEYVNEDKSSTLDKLNRGKIELEK